MLYNNCKNTSHYGGSIQADLAEEFENAQKQFIQAIPDLVMRLQDGQINALILETAVADSYIRNQAGLMIAPIAIGDSEDGTAVAVQKGNPELLTLIYSVIDELIKSGRMDEIVAAMVLLNS